MAEKARIVIADDSILTVEELRRNLGLLEGAEVVAHTRSGQELMEILEKQSVDLLIMDVVLQYKDGISVLENLSLMDAPRPAILVTSALGTEDVIRRCVGLGAHYFMLKPYDMGELCSRARELLQSPEARKPTTLPNYRLQERSLDEKLMNVFVSIGIPAHIKGFHYMREAIKMVMDEPELINAITKELYPGVAQRCHTTASKVERAIRHAIDVAWTRGRLEHINRIFGCTVYTSTEKPTNGEFIALMADKMTLERAATRARQAVE